MVFVVSLYDIIVIMEKLSREFQAIDNSADYASYGIEKAANRIQEMRTSEELARIFQKIECFEDLEDCEENQPRKRKMPACHSDFVVHREGMGAAVNEVNRSDQMKRAYFATIDAILQSIQTRYYQTDILVLKSMEKILLLAANKEPYPVDEFAKLVRRYASYLDPKSLTEELEELPFVVKMHNASAPKGSIIKRVTRVAQYVTYS